MNIDVICETEAHCRQCRAKEAGRRFRLSLQASFSGIAEVDFPCPKGRPWTTDPMVMTARLNPKNSVPSPYDRARAAIRAMTPSGPAERFLGAMLAQLEALKSENRGGSCQDRHAYRARIEAKLVYYFKAYAPQSALPSGA